MGGRLENWDGDQLITDFYMWGYGLGLVLLGFGRLHLLSSLLVQYAHDEKAIRPVLFVGFAACAFGFQCSGL
jgi:hypothetical protein